MLKKERRRGQRGLITADLVEAALEEIERGGLDGFSLRCAARAIGCDVATLSYHFGSKQGLEKAIAERLHSAIQAPDARAAWEVRLAGMARQYRALARQFPNAFPLLLRFWTSGPRDLTVAEHWHQALADAGIAEADIPAAGCATYASILGLCAGEVSGLLGEPSEEAIASFATLKTAALTRRLLPVFETLKAETVFETALAVIIAGLKATYAAKAKSNASAGGRERQR